MKKIMRAHRRVLSRVSSVSVVVVLMVSGFAQVALANHEFDVVIPIETVVRAPEGSITQLASPIVVPIEAQGQECDVTSHAENQGSVHPNNDILVESGASQVVVPDVEAVSGGTVDGDGTLVLGSTIVVSLRMGSDRVFSAGFTLHIKCAADHYGRIIVVKQVTEGSDTSQAFDFTASYDTDGFSLSDGQTNDSGELLPGTYSVAETLPAGWTQVSAVCDDESPVGEIDLQAGETVTCTFTNETEPPVVGASIVVTVAGTCVLDGDNGSGLISVTLSVADGATVVVSDSDGVIVGTFSSDGSVTVPEGAVYSWLATPSEGFEFPAGFAPSGTFAVETCSTPGVLPFTGLETNQLATLGLILLAAGVLVMTSGWYLLGWKEES